MRVAQACKPHYYHEVPSRGIQRSTSFCSGHTEKPLCAGVRGHAWNSRLRGTNLMGIKNITNVVFQAGWWKICVPSKRRSLLLVNCGGQITHSTEDIPENISGRTSITGRHLCLYHVKTFWRENAC